MIRIGSRRGVPGVIPLGIVLAFAAAGASAASFDCAKARSASERLICSDPRLSALDDKLAALAAAGKKQSDNPRAFQRALDQAWLMRQKCQDAACVEAWYAQRIDVLSRAVPEDLRAAAPVAAQTAPLPVAPNADVNAKDAPAKAAPQARPAPVAASARLAKDTQNVNPGAHFQVIGEGLGLDIPVTKDDFLHRFAETGGECGASKNLPALKSLARSAVSDCWSGSYCSAPAESLSCKSVRTAYDSKGRLVAYSTTLNTGAAAVAEGARELKSILRKFSDVAKSEPRTRDTGHGQVMSAAGSQGEFKLQAEVQATKGDKHVGVFSIASD